MIDIFVEATRDMINSPLGEQIIYALIIVVPILLVFYFVYQDSIIEKFSDGVLYVIIYGSVCFLLFLKYPRLKDVFIDAIFLGSFAFFYRLQEKRFYYFLNGLKIFATNGSVFEIKNIVNSGIIFFVGFSPYL